MEWSDLRFWKSPAYRDLKDYIRIRETYTEVYPPKELRLKAFDITPFDQVRVVILGQDPYTSKGQAHGLSFSVQPTVKPIPPSLHMVFKEYQADLGFPQPRNGDLSRWAANGVLLLNTILTVERGKPLSHANKGWEKLTYEAVSALCSKRSSIVWMLWGSKAQEFRGAIDESKHLVVASGHPSPLARSAEVPFLGSAPFSKACEYLGVSKEMWRL